jgi:putative FmdB family regulatory protein
MPTYEYECRSCGAGFDAFQSMSDAPLTVCPSCGGGVRRKINGGTGIIFKGSGFYKNDSRKASSSSVGSSAGSSESGGAKAGSESAASGESSGGAKKAAGACADCPASGGAAAKKERT